MILKLGMGYSIISEYRRENRFSEMRARRAVRDQENRRQDVEIQGACGGDSADHRATHKNNL